MTEHIATAPKDGTKILCVCSDGKTRYCWWFGCSDVDGCWMTEGVAEPVAWYPVKRLPPSLKEQALETLRSMQIEPCWINGINTNAELMSKYDIIRRALEAVPE